MQIKIMMDIPEFLLMLAVYISLKLLTYFKLFADVYSLLTHKQQICYFSIMFHRVLFILLNFKIF